MNNLNPDNFPEPIKSLIKSLDLSALQGLPPNDALNMVQGIMGLLKNTMPQQDYQALEQLIGTMIKNKG